MKKLTLISLMLLGAASLYAKVSPYINTLMPRDRQALAQAMIESADAYEKAGNKKRALEYRKAALEVYPIGDDAHALARSLNAPLDDEKTYSNFVNKGDAAFKARNYGESVVDYLMALELRQPVDLYEKLQQSYLGMGDRLRAANLQAIIDQAKAAPASDSETYTEEGGYSAEAEYPQEYPLDGYGQEEGFPQEYPSEPYGDGNMMVE